MKSGECFLKEFGYERFEKVVNMLGANGNCELFIYWHFIKYCAMGN